MTEHVPLPPEAEAVGLLARRFFPKAENTKARRGRDSATLLIYMSVKSGAAIGKAEKPSDCRSSPSISSSRAPRRTTS